MSNKFSQRRNRSRRPIPICIPPPPPPPLPQPGGITCDLTVEQAPAPIGTEFGWALTFCEENQPNDPPQSVNCEMTNAGNCTVGQTGLNCQEGASGTYKLNQSGTSTLTVTVKGPGGAECSDSIDINSF